MGRKLTSAFFSVFLLTALLSHRSYAKTALFPIICKADSSADSIATRKSLMAIINKVIEASGNFEISAVGDLYTLNATVADEEPPFSWNGPTAGAQWVNAVEKTCKDLKIRKLKGRVGHISIYLQTGESVYVIVPATYSGDIHGDPFEESGAFTFVFRLVNGKWLIKSQVWMPRRGL
jgi:hypothetical protein